MPPSHLFFHSTSILIDNKTEDEPSRREGEGEGEGGKKMAMSRAALQSALRRLGRPNAPAKRNFSSSAHDDARKKKKKQP